MIIQAGVIRHVFYPVHPSEKNANAVISWLKTNVVVEKGPMTGLGGFC